MSGRTIGIHIAYEDSLVLSVLCLRQGWKRELRRAQLIRGRDEDVERQGLDRRQILTNAGSGGRRT
jgi:hypothetical protein